MKDKKIFGSVCSGIEAASVAWEQLGWECAFVSEIDHFPSAVLKHRYPDVPNFGDFTTITYEKVKKEGKHPVIDVLIGGTPCQSFSVAGLRKGLESENGNLALEFVRLLSRLRPRWFVWENVPGVFSSSGGSDFASILAGFTGRVVGVPAEGWRNSGSIEGIAEAYDVSWRVLDAQYFGVAQRRRRVFVVGHLVECAGFIRGEEFQEHGRIPNLASAVLFESDCLQGNPEPRREKRERTPTSTQGGVDPSGEWISPNGSDVVGAMRARDYKGIGNDDLTEGRGLVIGALDTECGGNKLTHQSVVNGHIIPTWWNGEDLEATLTKQNANGAQRMPDKDNFGAVIEPIPIHDQATRFNGKRGDNQDGKGNGLGIGDETDPMFTLTKGDQHAVFQDSTLSLNSKQMGLDVGDEIASTILSTDYKEPQVVTYQTPIPYRKSARAQTTEDSETWVEDEVSNTLNNFDVGDIRTTHAVVEPQYYESHPNDSRVTGPNDVANSVTSRYDTGGGNTPLVTQPDEIEPIAVDTYNQTINTETTQSLSSAASDVNHYGAVIEPVVFDRAAFNQGENAKYDPLIEQTELMPSLVARGPHGVHLPQMAIRRLTPIECERLQGFPNNWTKIPYRGKHEDSCPDGPRYKACGNSMATPVIKWIGERIDLIQSIADER
jgi:DNA (cytosine-5)-methyltransferase 1